MCIRDRWVIDSLTEGDVVVCDLYDKIYKGTFAGGNLTTAIQARTVTGLSLIHILLAVMLPVGALADAIGTVDTDALVLRKSNSKESKALQTLSRGDTMDILSKSGSWYKVRYGKYTGYVMIQ